MFMSRSLKTKALSMYSLRLSMYIMLISRFKKKMEHETYYISITAIYYAYILLWFSMHIIVRNTRNATHYYCDSVFISCLSGFLDELQKAKDILIIITTAMHSL